LIAELIYFLQSTLQGYEFHRFAPMVIQSKKAR
jgi:hypothetical protein